jgi:hypothetical protein
VDKLTKFGAMEYTTIVSATSRNKRLKVEGACGTAGARSSENLTSSAVKGVPSWKRTPVRSLTSQVVSSSAFHDVARLGPTFPVLVARGEVIEVVAEADALAEHGLGIPGLDALCSVARVSSWSPETSVGLTSLKASGGRLPS